MQEYFFFHDAYRNALVIRLIVEVFLGKLSSESILTPFHK